MLNPNFNLLNIVLAPKYSTKMYETFCASLVHFKQTANICSFVVWHFPTI